MSFNCLCDASTILFRPTIADLVIAKDLLISAEHPQKHIHNLNIVKESLSPVITHCQLFQPWQSLITDCFRAAQAQGQKMASTD